MADIMEVIIALIRNADGDILLQKRIDPMFPEADGKWEMPGGRREEGEHPLDTVIRECQEEIGCHIKIGRLLPLIQTKEWEKKGGGTATTNVSCYEAVIERGVPKVCDSKVAEVRWYTEEEIGKLDVLKGIKEFIELSSYGKDIF